MGAALYLSLVLLAFFLVRAAASQIKGDGLTLSPRDVPEGVCRAARRLMPEMVVESVRVSMDGPDAVGYRVTGRLPGGQVVLVAVDRDGSAWRLDPLADRDLPEAVRQGLGRYLPFFHPLAGTVRLVRARDAWWYAMEGTVTGGGAVRLTISADGRYLTLRSRETGPPEGGLGQGRERTGLAHPETPS